MLMIAGMCPGPDEIKEGEPFIGKSGHILNQAIRKAGTSRELAYTTNVVKCFVTPGHPLPAGAVTCCAPLIQTEFDSLPNHTTTLTLGGEAFHAFTHKKLVSQSPARHGHKKPPDPNVWLRGCVYPVGRTRQIVPAVHPAFIARAGYKDLPFFERDVDRAVRFSEGRGVRVDDTYNYKASSQEVLGYIEEIHAAGHFGVDIETPYGDADEEERTAPGVLEIQVVGLSARLGECIGVAPDQLPLLKSLFQHRVGKTRVRAYAYNWGFDGYHLGAQFDTSAIEAFDVMKAFYLVYSDSIRHDLGTALSWFTDMPYHKNLQFTQPELYNARDTWGALAAGLQAEKEMRML
jgi:uracil-DNA glycosylase family 4